VRPLPQYVERKLSLFVYECGGRRLHNYQSILRWPAKQRLSSNMSILCYPDDSITLDGPAMANVRISARRAERDEVAIH
jgi:hypothetical protein